MTAEAAPPLVLAAAYWLHMLATVVWIGGLAAVTLIVLPAARGALEPTAYAALLTRLLERLQQVGWFCLALLAVTGMFQMSSHPSYEGFLAINNNWSIAILTKHLVIGGMLLVSGYVTWGLLPAIQRMTVLRAAGRPLPEAQTARLRSREMWALRASLVLSALVLLLTAWARTAS